MQSFVSTLTNRTVGTFWDSQTGKFVKATFKPDAKDFNKKLSTGAEDFLKTIYSKDEIKLIVSCAKAYKFPLGLSPRLTKSRIGTFKKSYISMDDSGSMAGDRMKEARERIIKFMSLDCAIGMPHMVYKPLNGKIENFENRNDQNNSKVALQQKIKNIDNIKQIISTTQPNGGTPLVQDLYVFIQDIQTQFKNPSTIHIYTDADASCLKSISEQYAPTLKVNQCWDSIRQKAQSRLSDITQLMNNITNTSSTRYIELKKQLTEIKKHLYIIDSCNSLGLKQLAYLLETRDKTLSFVQFHICTEKKEDVEFINIFDYYITNDGDPNKFGVGVSDDPKEEGEEVLQHQVDTLTKNEAISLGIAAEMLSHEPVFDDLDEKPVGAEVIGSLHDYKNEREQQFSIDQQLALLQHQNTFNELPPKYQESNNSNVTHKVEKGKLVPLKN